MNAGGNKGGRLEAGRDRFGPREKWDESNSDRVKNEASTKRSLHLMSSSATISGADFVRLVR